MMNDPKQLHRILEGALFASGEPLSMERMIELFDENQKPEKSEIRDALTALQNDYQERGIELIEVASGFQFQVKADLSHWMKRLWEESPARYSRALLETLAIIAYRQPITRGEIEDIRGVAVSSPMTKTLIDREWIRIVGYKDVPGKPALFATTKNFLDHFRLKNLSDLPPLSEIRDLDELEKNLHAQIELEIDESENDTLDPADKPRDDESASSRDPIAEFSDDVENLDDDISPSSRGLHPKWVLSAGSSGEIEMEDE